MTKKTKILENYIENNSQLLTEVAPIVVFGVSLGSFVKGALIGYGGKSMVLSVVGAYGVIEILPVAFGYEKQIVPIPFTGGGGSPYAHAPGRSPDDLGPAGYLNLGLIKNFVSVASGKNLLQTSNRSRAGASPTTGNLTNYIRALNQTYDPSVIDARSDEYGQEHTESYHKFLMTRLSRANFHYFTRNRHPWLKFAGSTDSEGYLINGTWYIDEKGLYYSILRSTVFSMMQGRTARSMSSKGVDNYKPIYRRYYDSLLEKWDKIYPGGMEQKFGRVKDTNEQIELDTVFKVGFKDSNGNEMKGQEAVDNFKMTYGWTAHSSEFTEGIRHSALSPGEKDVGDVDEFYSLHNWEVTTDASSSASITNPLSLVPRKLRKELKLLLYGSDFDGDSNKTNTPTADLTNLSEQEIRKIEWNSIIDQYWEAVQKRLSNRRSTRKMPAFMSNVLKTNDENTMSAPRDSSDNLNVALTMSAPGGVEIPMVSTAKMSKLAVALYGGKDKFMNLQQAIDTRDLITTRMEQEFKLSGVKERERLIKKEKERREQEERAKKFTSREYLYVDDQIEDELDSDVDGKVDTGPTYDNHQAYIAQAQANLPPLEKRKRGKTYKASRRQSVKENKQKLDKNEVFKKYVSESNLKILQELENLLVRSEISNLSEQSKKEIIDFRNRFEKLKKTVVKANPTKEQVLATLNDIKSKETVLNKELPEFLNYVKNLFKTNTNQRDLVGEQQSAPKKKKKKGLDTPITGYATVYRTWTGRYRIYTGPRVNPNDLATWVPQKKFLTKSGEEKVIPELVKLLKSLKIDQPDAGIFEISVHASGVGPGNDRILKLTKARAKVLKSTLISRGIPADKIKVQGFGNKYPIDNPDLVKNRRKNARIEIKQVRKNKLVKKDTGVENSKEQSTTSKTSGVPATSTPKQAPRVAAKKPPRSTKVSPAKTDSAPKSKMSAVTEPVTNFLTQEESQAALAMAKNKPEQGYSKNQLKIIQKRLNRDFQIPPLSRRP